MIGKEGYAAPTPPPPRQVGDRFYNPPAVRRHQQIILQQQQQHQHQQMMQMQLLQQQQQQQQLQQQQLKQQQRQLQRKGKAKSSSSTAAEAEKPTDVDYSSMIVAFPVPRSIIPASSLDTNLDRVMNAVTPFIEARFLSKVNSHPFFCLEDLWEAFSEWSVYGSEVPLLINGRDSILQYYVPFLSGIQLYIDPSKTSTRIRKDDAAGSSRNYQGDRGAKSIMDLNLQRLSTLSLGDKSTMGSASSAADSSRLPLFQFLEHEQPYNRRPLADKISLLASKFPELSKLRSCDLLPSSWICVAWYPIYRIPIGPTLRDLDASFLTFHSLSTQPKSNFPPHELHQPNTRIVNGYVDPYPRISLPVFALAAYKLKGSIVSPSGAKECEQQDSLLQAADSWLNRMHVMLPDYQFFRSHMSYK